MCSSRRAAELFVTKTTRRPDARSRATASDDPGIGSWASQTTPSRSHSTVRMEPILLSITRRSLHPMQSNTGMLVWCHALLRFQLSATAIALSTT